MRVVLAEKPSVARELAAFLRASTRADGYFEGQGYQVTWALGHLATLKEPEDYDPALKRWSLEALPIVPEHFGLKLVEDRGACKQFAVIKPGQGRIRDRLDGPEPGLSPDRIYLRCHLGASLAEDPRGADSPDRRPLRDADLSAGTRRAR